MTADELVAFVEDLARIAAAGGGTKALADHLARKTRLGVLVEDAEWRHLAACGGQVPSSVRPLLVDGDPAREFSRLRNGYAGRTIAILAGDARLGQLSIFGEGELDDFKQLARLAASAIATDLARETGGQAGRKRAFWERLASGAYTDAAVARDDATARGVAAATHYIAVALEPEIAQEQTAADQSSLRAAAVAAFRATEGDAGVLERGGALALFVPATREIDAANARTAASLLPRTLSKKHPSLRISGGVGTRVPLHCAGESLQQAQAALTISRRLYGGAHVGVFEELGAYPILLGGGDAATLREFAAQTLSPLRAYDEKHQTELERTLRLYFSVGENVKTAAGELNVHRHTVFYRLRQIGEICGRKFDNPHDQLTLRMAIAIDALTT